MSVCLVPELILDATGVQRGLAVVIDPDTGRISAVIGAAHAPRDALRLRRTALMPGFVNAHSHAFQRDLRGVVERVESTPGGDFWGWRSAMYHAAAALDPEQLGDVSRRCFAQMRNAGYTSVGEFHYVHHHPGGAPYGDPNIMAKTVCEAAEAVGIRIVVLLAAYERGAAGAPLDPPQRRFADASIDAYLERLTELVGWAADRSLVQVGAAPHSVRGVSRAWLERIGAYCTEHNLVLHIHADEQPREVAECLAEHAVRPIQLIELCGALSQRTTIIHATHCDAAEIAALAAADASVCVCPSTEANLGDGYAPVQALFEAGVPMAVGSDANMIIDPLAELRELELIARRSAGRRTILVRAGDASPAPYLLGCGWQYGATAIALPPPIIEADAYADLVAVDLDRDEIADTADEHLAAAIVFAGSARLVTRTWVAGR